MRGVPRRREAVKKGTRQKGGRGDGVSEKKLGGEGDGANEESSNFFASVVTM